MNDTWKKIRTFHKVLNWSLYDVDRQGKFIEVWTIIITLKLMECLSSYLDNKSRDNICLESKLNLALTFIWPWPSSSKYWIMLNFSNEYIWLVCYDYLINIWELFITYLPWQGFDIRLSNHVITYRTINTRSFIYPVQPITRCHVFFVIYGNWPLDRDIRHVILRVSFDVLFFFV